MESELKFNSVSEAFDAFSKVAIPPEAGENQRFQTEAAFYAGALSIMKMQLDIKADDPNAGAILKGWYEECAAFAKGMIRRSLYALLERAGKGGLNG